MFYDRIYAYSSHWNEEYSPIGSVYKYCSRGGGNDFSFKDRYITFKSGIGGGGSRGQGVKGSREKRVKTLESSNSRNLEPFFIAFLLRSLRFYISIV